MIDKLKQLKSERVKLDKEIEQLEGTMKTKNGCVVRALLNKEVDFIFHQANCFNTFGRGVAKVVRELIPEAYSADQKTTKGDKSKLGTFSYGGAVYNIYGQYTYGTKKVETLYEHLSKGLLLASKDAASKKGGVAVVGVPLIGCGLAGGHWTVVKEILLGIEDTHNIEFIVYYL